MYEIGDLVSFNITQGYIYLLVIVFDLILWVFQPMTELLFPFSIFFLISVKDQRFLQQRFPFRVVSDHDRSIVYQASMLRSIRIPSLEIESIEVHDLHGLRQDFRIGHVRGGGGGLGFRHVCGGCVTALDPGHALLSIVVIM